MCTRRGGWFLLTLLLTTLIGGPRAVLCVSRGGHVAVELVGQGCCADEHDLVPEAAARVDTTCGDSCFDTPLSLFGARDTIRTAADMGAMPGAFVGVNTILTPPHLLRLHRPSSLRAALPRPAPRQLRSTIDLC
jgi:hypothetical protein